MCSEETELLLSGVLLSLGFDLDHVEANSLGEGSALAHSDNVALIDAGEGGRAVGSQVLVSLLESVVLLDVVQVVSSHNDGSLHLSGHHDAPITL